MSDNQAATQPGQETAAPTTAESAPAQETAPVTTEIAPQVTPPKQDSEPEWFKKRFDEITAKYREQERRASAAEQRAAQLEQERLRQQAPEKTKTLADFNYDESAFQGYVIEEARKAARQAATEADSERQREISVERRTRKFQERAVAFEKDNPDYRDVAHYAPISDQLAEVIQDMDSGPEIAYYLGKHRDVALSLSDLPPHIAAIELGRIDARLTSDRQAKQAALDKAKAEKAVSGAPPPPPKLEGAGNPGTVKADEPESDNISDAEWVRRRNKQLSKQRGA